jgi:hypothetical protein
MSGSVVFPIGWKPSTDVTDFSNFRWWEYKSVNQSGNLIDVSHRINPGSRQLTDEEAAYFRDVNNIFGNWNPQNLGEFPTPAWQPGPIDGATEVAPEGISLTWAAGAEATSHRVYFGTSNSPDSVGEQTGTSFATGAMLPNTTYYWRVDENNPAGVTTGTVWSFTTTYLCAGSVISDLDGDCEVDFLDYARLANAWAGDLMDIAQFAIEWLTCNRDPQSECWQ